MYENDSVPLKDLIEAKHFEKAHEPTVTETLNSKPDTKNDQIALLPSGKDFSGINNISEQLTATTSEKQNLKLDNIGLPIGLCGDPLIKKPDLKNYVEGQGDMSWLIHEYIEQNQINTFEDQHDQELASCKRKFICETISDIVLGELLDELAPQEPIVKLFGYSLTLPSEIARTRYLMNLENMNSLTNKENGPNTNLRDIYNMEQVYGQSEDNQLGLTSLPDYNGTSTEERMIEVYGGYFGNSDQFPRNMTTEQSDAETVYGIRTNYNAVNEYCNLLIKYILDHGPDEYRINMLSKNKVSP